MSASEATPATARTHVTKISDYSEAQIIAGKIMLNSSKDNQRTREQIARGFKRVFELLGKKPPDTTLTGILYNPQITTKEAHVLKEQDDASSAVANAKDAIINAKEAQLAEVVARCAKVTNENRKLVATRVDATARPEAAIRVSPPAKPPRKRRLPIDDYNEKGNFDQLPLRPRSRCKPQRY